MPIYAISISNNNNNNSNNNNNDNNNDNTHKNTYTNNKNFPKIIYLKVNGSQLAKMKKSIPDMSLP